MGGRALVGQLGPRGVPGEKEDEQGECRPGLLGRQGRGPGHAEAGDVGQAEADLDAALTEFTNLEIEFKAEVDKLGDMTRPDALPLEKIELTPRKADIAIEKVVLAWTPWTTRAEGPPEKAY